METKSYLAIVVPMETEMHLDKHTDRVGSHQSSEEVARDAVKQPALLAAAAKRKGKSAAGPSKVAASFISSEAVESDNDDDAPVRRSTRKGKGKKVVRD